MRRSLELAGYKEHATVVVPAGRGPAAGALGHRVAGAVNERLRHTLCLPSAPRVQAMIVKLHQSDSCRPAAGSTAPAAVCMPAIAPIQHSSRTHNDAACNDMYACGMKGARRGPAGHGSMLWLRQSLTTPGCACGCLSGLLHTLNMVSGSPHSACVLQHAMQMGGRRHPWPWPGCCLAPPADVINRCNEQMKQNKGLLPRH